MHTHKALKHVGQVSQVKDVVELQSCGHEDLESNIKSFVLLSVLQMKLKYLILAAIAGAIITFDQATKMYVHTHFSLHESIDVIQGFFNLTYVRNYGAAFGFLAESHPTFREIFFLSMPPVALLVILAILRTVHDFLVIVFQLETGNWNDIRCRGYGQRT